MNFVYMDFYYISAYFPSKTDENCFLQFQNQTPVKGISFLYALQCCCLHQENVFVDMLPTGQKNKFILVFVELPAQQHPTNLHFGGGGTFMPSESFCSSGIQML